MSSLAQFLLFGPFFHQGQLVTAPKLYHYIPGTSQEKTAWADRNKGITAANPIVGDANGLVAGYFSGLYKIVVKTSDGVNTLVQYDNVQIIDSTDELAKVEVRPEEFGGEPTSSMDNTDAIHAALGDLPAAGGKVRLAPGDYKFSGTLDYGSRSLTIQGAGIDVTYLTLTAVDTKLHGLVGTGSLWLRDLTLRTQSPLTVYREMFAIRLDLDGTGIASGRYLQLDHVKITGFNAGAYCDGGAAYGIELATYDHCVVQPSGELGTSQIGSSLHMNRVQNGIIRHCNVDQNDVGEHGIYCFAPRNLAITHTRVKKASLSECQAIKLVGDGVAADGTFENWVLDDVVMESCTHGLMLQTFGSEKVGLISLSNLKAKDIEGSVSINGSLVIVNVLGTSVIDQIRMTNLTGENLGMQGIHFTGGGTAKVKLAVIDGATVKGWSQLSSGTYTLLGSNAATEVVERLVARSIRADGDGTGREIWNVNSFGGHAAPSIGSFEYEDLTETGTTLGPFTPAIEAAEATPSLRFGRKYLLTNPSAQNITGFVDMIPDTVYEFRVTNGNSTLKEGANLSMAGSVDWNPQSTDRFRLVAVTATTAIEDGRSDNT